MGILVFGGFLWTLAVLIVGVTLLPMWDTTAWWVRAMDFPRVQIASVCGLVLVAALFLPGPTRMVLPVMMIVAGGYQLWRIAPYTPLYGVEMKLAPHGEHEVRVLASNVLMENRRHELLIDAIDAFDPDVLLLMEVDETWNDAMQPVLERYTTVVREPRSDHYGMIFATRLEADEARMVRLTTDETPSVFSQLKGPDGTTFRFVGLHPRPPVPGEDTDERDAQIYYAARFAAKSGVPLIAMGDFNDVAWSDTSQSFRHVGRYLDPRIGRGFFSSFHATKPYMRFPIDHFFATEDIAVVSIQRLGFVGSDHFPMAATIRLDAALASELNKAPEPISEDQRELVAKSVERTRELLGQTPP